MLIDNNEKDGGTTGTTDTTIEEFLLKALQPPPTANIRQSIELLQKIDALDNSENITQLGQHLANMPIDCQMGKMVLYARLMHCLDPVITIASILSVNEVFMLPLSTDAEEIEKLNMVKQEFARHSNSDHQMILNIYDEWTKQRPQHEFCRKNSISQAKMLMIQGIRRLIVSYLKNAGFICENAEKIMNLNENSMEWSVVKACLTAGLYPNVNRIFPKEDQKWSSNPKLTPHPASIVHEPEFRQTSDATGAKWMIYGEKLRLGNSFFIRNVSIVTTTTIALFTEQMEIIELPLASEKRYLIKVGNLISFITDETEAKFLSQLQLHFPSLFKKLLYDPKSFQMANQEDSIRLTLLEMLKNEDKISKYLNEKETTMTQESFKKDQKAGDAEIVVNDENLDENGESSWDSNNPTYNRAPLVDLSRYRIELDENDVLSSLSSNSWDSNNPIYNRAPLVDLSRYHNVAVESIGSYGSDTFEKDIELRSDCSVNGYNGDVESNND